MDNKRYIAVIKEYYKAMTGISVRDIGDIPQDTLQFMAGMEYLDMAGPIIVRALKSGVGIRTLASVYGVSRGTVRRLKRLYMPVVHNVTPKKKK